MILLSVYYPSTTHKKLEHLVVIDDNIFIQQVIGHTLTQSYTVTALTNVHEAPIWFSENQLPDLIIVDWEASMTDGTHLIQYIRTTDRLQHIPILVLSAQFDSRTRIECLKMGADDCLSKPFNPLELLAYVRAQLRRTVQPPSPNVVLSA